MLNYNGPLRRVPIHYDAITEFICYWQKVQRRNGSNYANAWDYRDIQGVTTIIAPQPVILLESGYGISNYLWLFMNSDLCSIFPMILHPFFPLLPVLARLLPYLVPEGDQCTFAARANNEHRGL